MAIAHKGPWIILLFVSSTIAYVLGEYRNDTRRCRMLQDVHSVMTALAKDLTFICIQRNKNQGKIKCIKYLANVASSTVQKITYETNLLSDPDQCRLPECNAVMADLKKFNVLLTEQRTSSKSSSNYHCSRLRKQCFFYQYGLNVYEARYLTKPYYPDFKQFYVKEILARKLPQLSRRYMVMVAKNQSVYIEEEKNLTVSEILKHCNRTESEKDVVKVGYMPSSGIKICFQVFYYLMSIVSFFCVLRL